VSLGFSGATDENLSQSDRGMSASEISIQRQRIGLRPVSWTPRKGVC
jgi:hypothetical protein